MSGYQGTQQQQPQEQHYEEAQQQDANAKGKTKKKRNRKRRSKGNVKQVECRAKSLEKTGGVGDSLAFDKELLNNSVGQLQVVQSLTPLLSRKAAGSNWEAVTKANQSRGTKVTVNKQEDVADSGSENVSSGSTTLTKSQRRRRKRREAQERYVAIDCEMVGVGANGQDDMLARVSIVNRRGEVLLDKFVKPQKTVTDYRTRVSGIRPHDMDNGEDMKSVQNEVIQILQGKVLIGHGTSKDLAVLRIKHPYDNIRDTAFYKPLRRLTANGRTPSLKCLTQAILGKEIQTGEHNSVEDARAVMSIYNCLANDWEQYLRKHQRKSGK